MPWTKEDTQNLRNYRNIIDSDDIFIKQRVKQILLGNRNLIHLLNNRELDEDEPDSYYGINILPYYLIPTVQTSSQNYLTYMTQTDEEKNHNNRVKYMELVFTVLCDEKTLIDQDTWLPRHDLIAALLINDFNWTNYFGPKIHCISNKELYLDKANYAGRQVIFSMQTDNNLVKTINNVPRLINNYREYEQENN